MTCIRQVKLICLTRLMPTGVSFSKFLPNKSLTVGVSGEKKEPELKNCTHTHKRCWESKSKSCGYTYREDLIVFLRFCIATNPHLVKHLELNCLTSFCSSHIPILVKPPIVSCTSENHICQICLRKVGLSTIKKVLHSSALLYL